VRRTVKRRLRRAVFLASLGAAAVAGLAAGAVSAVASAATGHAVAVELLWTAAGFLLVAFVMAAEGAVRRLFRRGA
jgi:hypothetical protein